MKKSMFLAFLAVGALLGAGYVLLPPDRTEVDRRGSEANVTQTPVTDADAASQVAPVEEPAADDSEYELVHGLWVRKDRNCTVQLHYVPAEDGTMIEAYSCVPDSEPEKHPYHAYSSETLLALSYSDAKAAEILGTRLRETDNEMAMRLAIRASALTGGDTTPMQRYSDSYPVADRIDGEPVIETIRVKYVISAVSELLGAQQNNYDFWREQIVNSFDEPHAALAELNDRAGQIVAEMQAIEIEVKGEATIQPVKDLDDT